ncbi:MAG TPA: TonB-dependent receptor, partial [Saprospiraceae bacterium]|nr:TonB-dependent receptor [Saprospiraceae bacterium]
FPISKEANFFAHYDILVQRPPSNTIATPRDYFYFTDISYGPNNPINNPNLRPERTIDYEVGFQQKLSNTSAIKIAAYYKEMRDMIQLRTFFPVPLVIQYTTYDNQDFGTVKGFTFQYDLRRTGNVSINANYTLQFADGTGSDANSQRGLTSRGNLRTLFPLNFDERHRIVANLDYRYGSGKRYNGPQILGSDVFANAGLNLQGIIVSGRPYTAQSVPVELGGAGAVGSLNGARKPWNFTLNARLDKTFVINKQLGLNVYCRVSNLLDRRNIINVYSVTGSATDDGFLRSVDGQRQIRNIQNSARELDAYLASYQWALLNPNFFSLPRRIFLGAIFDF